MMEWISVKDELPSDFNERGRTKSYLVWIDNPFFHDGNAHVAQFERGSFGDHWRGIEPNVHHGNNPPNVTHWMPLPEKP